MRCALIADTRMVAYYKRVFITTTTICVSELNVLLVYPACSKLKYCAFEADCHTSARYLFPIERTSLSLSISLSLCVCSVSGWTNINLQNLINNCCLKIKIKHLKYCLIVFFSSYFTSSLSQSLFKHKSFKTVSNVTLTYINNKYICILKLFNIVMNLSDLYST